MKIKIIPAKANDYGKAADAEVSLDGSLTGFTLTGFTLWKKRSGSGFNVTFPDRKYKVGTEDRRYEFLRSTDQVAIDTLKTNILNAFLAQTQGEED
jgi:hypothetical protein